MRSHGVLTVGTLSMQGEIGIMIVAPLTIEQDGPGIDLTNQADGVALLMADPVTENIRGMR